MSNQLLPTRQIVAMGGGGFSEEPDNPLLDDFVLGLSGKKTPRVCFVPTASGDAQGYIDKFYNAFPPERAEATHLSLFRDSRVRDLRAFLLDQDVVYVGGGSTVNMLAIWRVHGIDRIVREAWISGVILVGLSAGMICWFEQSLTDAFGGGPSALRDGLGFLEGSACPHYDREPSRRPAYHRCIATGELLGGVAADDGAAIHYVGAELTEAVSSGSNARAYSVKLEGNEVAETPMPTRYLAVDSPGS